MTPALLALEDGSLFQGVSIGIDGRSVGEVVFNTAMTGYQEILTDPSYARQIVTLTYPQIGNTGVNAEDMESEQVWASGLIIRQTPRLASSWRMTQTLPEFLRRTGCGCDCPGRYPSSHQPDPRKRCAGWLYRRR